VVVESVFEHLLERVREYLLRLTDGRSGNNRRYDVSDAVLSAFSVFFLQNPSFLSSQVEVERRYGKNNAGTIFGVHKLPSSNQLRSILDNIPPQTFEPVFEETLHELECVGRLGAYRSASGKLYVALDGTGYFSSSSIHCEKCTRKELASGEVVYCHTALTPAIVSAGQARVIPLMPEFVEPQDGHEKQDCEREAAKRWLMKNGAKLHKMGAIILGDDLYSCQPLLEQIREAGVHFITVAKPSSHKVLYEYLDGAELTTVTTTSRKVRAKSAEVTTYRFLNDVPLRGGDDALSVNWCDVTVVKGDKVIYRNAFVTDLTITEENVHEIVTGGRSRWKIENENNNVLKNHGYHFEHNFGHGKQFLSQTLLTLNTMAFLFHTVLDFQDAMCQQLRTILPRKMFFSHIAVLTFYMVHDSWDDLLQFMWEGIHRKHRLPIAGAG
jgi:hypothetical protein